MVSSQLVVEMSTPSSWVRTGSIELTMLPSSGPANAPTATPANALYAANRPSRGSDSVGAGGLVGRAVSISATASSSLTAVYDWHWPQDTLTDASAAVATGSQTTVPLRLAQRSRWLGAQPGRALTPAATP